MALTYCPECGHEVSEMAQACPSCGYPIREETVHPEAYPFTAANSLIVALVSAGVIIIGSLLPWVAVDSVLGTVRLVNGTEGDGVFALFAGILIVVVAGVAVARESASGATAILLILLAAVPGLVAVNVFSGVADVASLTGDTPLSSVQSGLWLVLIGSAAGVGAGISAYGHRDERPERDPGRSLAGLWVGIVYGFALAAALFVVGDEALQNDLGDVLREDIADRLRDFASELRRP